MLYGNELVFFRGLPLLPFSGSREGKVDDLAVSAVLAREDEEVELVTLLDLGAEVEAEMLDEDGATFLVLALDGLSRVAGLADGLVVDGEVGVLDIVSSQPVVIVLEGHIDSPLQLRRRTYDLARCHFAKRTTSHLLTLLSVDCDGQDEGEG